MGLFDDFTTEQLLNMCGHAYDAACLHHAKHDAAYADSLKLLLDIVDELMRRTKKRSRGHWRLLTS